MITDTTDDDDLAPDEETSEYMTVEDFAAKAGWEGGILGALDYGLKHTDLDPADETAKPLRAAWKRLEDVYHGAFAEAVAGVRHELEGVETR